MKFNEQHFVSWAKPPGKTEEERIERTINAVKKAVSKHPALKTKSLKVLVQGSFENNTNVRQDSDVDVAIVCTETSLNTYPEGMTREDFGLYPAKYPYQHFRVDLIDALVNHFGDDAVTPKNKTINVSENTYRVDADITPVCVHHRYNKQKGWIKPLGTAFICLDETRIINWPEQHLANGRTKNTDTGGRYKKVVRILKRLNLKLADPVPGFLIECLVWNVPNPKFGQQRLTDDVISSMSYIYDALQDGSADEWPEASRLKKLFHSTQKWTKNDAITFLSSSYALIETE